MMARLETQLKQIWRTLSGENLHQANALLPSILKGRSVSLPHRIHIHRLFEELIISNNNETETGREVAIWQHDESVTFTDLNQRANILARVLAKMLRDHGSEIGKQENSIIGIFMPSSPNRIAIQLACFKLGLAYLPLDLELSNQMIEYIVHDVQPLCVLFSESYYKCRENLLDRIGNHCLIFFEDLYKTAIQRCTKVNNLEPEECLFISNDPLAIILYTSDNDELSKGVKIHHSNIYNRLIWQWDKIVYQEHDIVCCKSSFLSVTAIWELFACLLRGIPIVLSTPIEVEDIYTFSKQIAERYITWILLVPMQLRQWLAVLKDNSSLVSKLLSLQTVIVSGEVLHPSQAHLFFNIFPNGKRLVYVYGTSEVCGYVLSQVYNNDDEVCKNTETEYLSVGQPMYNTDIYVVDNKLQPVEIKTNGQICLSGFTVSKGFWDRTSKPTRRSLRESRRVLSENLIQPRRGYGQLHCTNDVGLIKDGHVFFKGSFENYIKLDNLEFEAGKIDNVVWMHPSIEVCSTVAIPSPNKETATVTFYTTKLFSDVNPTELQAMCALQLPLYIKPEFLQISEMPTNPISFTTDQHKLRQFYFEYTATLNCKAVRQESLTSDNARIRAVLAKDLHFTPNELLDTDDFYVKGGTPNIAAKCTYQLRSLGYKASIRAFMATNCIGRLLPMLKHAINIVKISNQPTISYKICEMQESDTDVTYFLAEHLLDHDLLVKAFKISYEDLANFIEDNRNLAVHSGVSLVARSLQDDIILGVAIVFRWEEVPMPNGSTGLDMLGEYMRICGTSITEFQSDPQEGSRLQLFLCSSDWNKTDGRLALEVRHSLETMVLSVASTNEFTAVEAISTSGVEKTIREDLGYENVAVSSLDGFLQDNDLPVLPETTNITSQLMIHRLGKSDDMKKMDCQKSVCL